MSRHALPTFVACALLALAGCRSSEPPPAAAAEAAAKKPEGDVHLSPEALAAARLTVGPARKVKQSGGLVAVGALELAPKRVAKVGTLVEGRVVSLTAQVGDKVKPGQTLATIESVSIGRARAEYLEAEARVRQSEKELAREKNLVADRASTERALLAAQTAHDVAHVELRAAAEKLRAVGVGAGAVGDRGRGASSAVSLSSPLAGAVLESKARVGEAVSPSDTLYVVGDLSELWLLVEVYERDLARVRPGDPAKVTVLAYPGKTFEGRVEHVHDAIDPVRHAADVRVVLANAEGLLRPGMSATARLEVGPPADLVDAGAEAREVVVVPRAALSTIDGLPHVFVEKEPGTYFLRPVDLGAPQDADVEVRRGVAEGERVVVEGAFVLKSEVLREQMGKND